LGPRLFFPIPVPRFLLFRFLFLDSKTIPAGFLPAPRSNQKVGRVFPFSDRVRISLHGLSCWPPCSREHCILPNLFPSSEADCRCPSCFFFSSQFFSQLKILVLPSSGVFFNAFLCFSFCFISCYFFLNNKVRSFGLGSRFPFSLRDLRFSKRFLDFFSLGTFPLSLNAPVSQGASFFSCTPPTPYFAQTFICDQLTWAPLFPILPLQFFFFFRRSLWYLPPRMATVCSPWGN